MVRKVPVSPDEYQSGLQALQAKIDQAPIAVQSGLAGLLLLTASLYSFTGIAVDSTYGELLPGFLLLGIGIAMTMSPMTSAAMNAVPVQKAGIASGVLSMFRMVGGSLGIAVTGAIFQGAVNADRYLLTFIDANHNAAAPYPPPSESYVSSDGGRNSPFR